MKRFCVYGFICAWITPLKWSQSVTQTLGPCGLTSRKQPHRFDCLVLKRRCVSSVKAGKRGAWGLYGLLACISTTTPSAPCTTAHDEKLRRLGTRQLAWFTGWSPAGFTVFVMLSLSAISFFPQISSFSMWWSLERILRGFSSEVYQ